MASRQFGRYTLLDTLGEGAMGVVYRAQDGLLERQVALKTVKLEGEREQRQEFEGRFFREAQSVAKLNHPGIVTVFDAGKVLNTAYIAMEFVDGDTLAHLFTQHRYLPIEAVLSIGLQIAEALAYAHQHKIVHGDVKPANIMIGRNGVAKLLDFGISYAESSRNLTHNNMLMGSPQYMAPEQIRGLKCDGRADIFSLGVVLYQIATGHFPFDGADHATLMHHVLTQKPEKPRYWRSDLPSAFERIVARMLIKNPEKRYQTAQAVSKELSKLLKHIVYRRANPDERLALIWQRIFVQHQHQHGPIPETQLFTAPLPLRQSSSHANRWKLLLGGGVVCVLLSAVVVYYVWLEKQRAIQAQKKSNTKPATLATTPTPKVESKPTTASPNGLTVALPEKPLAEEVVNSKNKTKMVEPLSSAAPEVTKLVDHSAPMPSTTDSTTDESLDEKKADTVHFGVVKFQVMPWGEVFVDGKSYGLTPPLKELSLPTGEHEVVIRNPASKAYTVTLDVKAKPAMNTVKVAFK